MKDPESPPRRLSLTISLDRILERVRAKRLREAWLRTQGVLPFRPTRRKDRR